MIRKKILNSLIGIETISLPFNSKILSFGIQDSSIVMWYSFSNFEESSARVIYKTFTGQEEPLRMNFITTLQMGAMVYHIYI